MDTNVAIELIRRSPTARQRLHPDAVIYVPTVVLGELFHGAFNSNDPNKGISEVEHLAASSKILVCDLGVSRWYGQVRQALWRKGKPLPENDIWIAAVAFTHGLPVVTRDRHFDEVDGLQVIHW